MMPDLFDTYNAAKKALHKIDVYLGDSLKSIKQVHLLSNLRLLTMADRIPTNTFSLRIWVSPSA